MADLVRSVIYPRGDQPREDWIRYIATLPAFTEYIPSVEQSLEGYRSSAGRTLDVRRLDSVVDGGWLGYFTEMVPRHMAGIAQELSGYRLPERGDRRSGYYHRWEDDGTWRFTAAQPASTYQVAFYPALDQSLQSFRLRRLPQNRPKRYGSVSSTSDPTLIGVVADFQGGSFRMPDRARFSYAHHGWLDLGANIWTNIPNVIFTAAYDQSWESYGTPKRRTRGDESLWNAVSRAAAAFPEDPRIWAPAFAHLTESFRVTAPTGLDVWRSVADPGFGWLSYLDLVEAIPRQRPALEQALASFRMGRRAAPTPVLADWPDLGAWLSQFSMFDPARWAAIGALLDVYRMGDRERTDVRRLDLPHDGWISTAPTLVVPTWTGAFIGLAEGFRVPARRVSMDWTRAEWMHDLAWLKEPLGLIEPEPTAGRRVGEQWAASVRRRHRLRMRRRR